MSDTPQGPQYHVEPAKPHVVEVRPYSHASVKRRLSDGTHDYGCSWPGCNFTATKVSSIGSHYKSHSGQAARRRRGERPSQSTEITELRRLGEAALDHIQNLLQGIDSYEDENASIKAKAAKWDALRGLVDDE